MLGFAAISIRPARQLNRWKQSVGAEEGTRTPTPLRVHGPEPCASANSATSAMRCAGELPGHNDRETAPLFYRLWCGCQTDCQNCQNRGNCQDCQNANEPESKLPDYPLLMVTNL